MDNEAFGGLIGLLLIVAAAVLSIGMYVLPSAIAVVRKHHQAGAIIALNILLGWTFLGWVVAAVWACTATYRR